MNPPGLIAVVHTLAVAGASRDVAWMFLAAYTLLSAATMIAYRADKRAAQAGRWRIPEGRLHLMGLLGGWPGALLAQQLFRHKTKKARFRIVFWATVVINVAVTAWIVWAV